jgi:hypothetical protein
VSAPDPDLLAYVEGIERHLRRFKGAEVVLSPPEFALARTWHAAGIPLTRVLAGIDGAQEDGAPPRSLLFYRRRVEEPSDQGSRRRTARG